MTFGMGGTGTSDNAHEFIHRPFVWAYWLVGSLAAGRLFSILAARRPQLWTRGIVVSAIILTLVPVCYGSGLQRGKGSVGNVRSSIHVDRGLIDCARYIRNQPPADAVVQDSQLDKFLIVGGLSDRPSFAARVDEWTRQSKVFRESPYQEQLGKLQRLQQATTFRICSAASAKLGFAGTWLIQTIPTSGQPSFAISRHSSPTAIEFTTCSVAFDLRG